MDLDPQHRLDYAAENDIPYLQGSTFYGIVNRTTFYNDDYQKKYASVPEIKASLHDLKNAIKFCAKECSQGREIEAWETESIFAYFWSLQLTLGDLELSEEEKKKIATAYNENISAQRAVHILEKKFPKKYAATFSSTAASAKSVVFMLRVMITSPCT